MAQRAYLGSIYRRAVEHAKAGKKELAYTNFDRLRPHYPGSPTLLLWLAFVSSDRAESRRLIDSVAEQQPDHLAFGAARAWLEEQERYVVGQVAPSESTATAYLAALSTLSFATIKAPPPKLETSGLPPELHLMATAALTEGEQIFWTGQPDPDLLFKQNIRGFWRRTVLILLLLLLPAGVFFGLNLIFFAILAAFVTYAMFRRETIYKASFLTAYVLTNRRIIIITSHPYKLKSYYPHHHLRITKIRLVERPDGTGNLFFSKAANSPETGLVGISQARRVKELMERVLRKTPAPKATLEPQYSWPALEPGVTNEEDKTPNNAPTPNP